MALEKAAETAINLLVLVFAAAMLLWLASCVGCGALLACPPPESRTSRPPVPMKVPDPEQVKADRELVERAAKMRRDREKAEAAQRLLRQRNANSPPDSRSSGRSLGGRWESNFDLCASNMRRQGFRTESFIRDECEALATAAGGESLATMVEEIERCVAAGRSESSCLASHPIFRRLPQR